ncbi:11524_t:CDS:1 [Diversispora eburnea]|uniref:11524_t:CDS:1 n=1 Tax=Diversispora eburnea TaxID=1213867 RepID=A0A9N9A748_9GLOM|nr:11524_t:CDS:1 [Diversispora eburnea]
MIKKLNVDIWIEILSYFQSDEQSKYIVNKQSLGAYDTLRHYRIEINPESHIFVDDLPSNFKPHIHEIIDVIYERKKTYVTFEKNGRIIRRLIRYRKGGEPYCRNPNKKSKNGNVALRATKCNKKDHIRRNGCVKCSIKQFLKDF